MFRLETDLNDHARIEDKVLVPKVRYMEKWIEEHYTPYDRHGLYNVIIADLSQLIATWIDQPAESDEISFPYPGNSSPDKLTGLPSKDQAEIFIVSSTFLRKCSPSLIQSLQIRFNSTGMNPDLRC